MFPYVNMKMKDRRLGPKTSAEQGRKSGTTGGKWSISIQYRFLTLGLRTINCLVSCPDMFIYRSIPL